MGKNMVSFYNICQEIYKQQRLGSEFQNFYDMQKERYRELLSSVGIDIESLKCEESGHILIPESKKDTVKKLLPEYTEKPIKQIRKMQYRNIPNDTLKKVIDDVEGIVEDTLDGYKKYEELSRMYMVTRVKLDEALEHLKEYAINKIQSDIENLRLVEKGEGKLPERYSGSVRMLSENDKIALVAYYEQLLLEVREKFNEIVKSVEDMRSDEIIELSEKEGIDEDQQGYDHYMRTIGSKLKNIDILIYEAVEEYEGRMSKAESEDDTLDEIGRIIEKMIQSKME